MRGSKRGGGGGVVGGGGRKGSGKGVAKSQQRGVESGDGNGGVAAMAEGVQDSGRGSGSVLCVRDAVLPALLSIAYQSPSEGCCVRWGDMGWDMGVGVRREGGGGW